MSIYQLKTQFQNQLRPISNALVANGVTANQVTMASIVLSATTAYIITHHKTEKISGFIDPVLVPFTDVDYAATSSRRLTNWRPDSLSSPTPRLQQRIWFLLPAALFIRMALNAIDGMMAREHNQASKLGAILNEMGDIVSDRLLIASLHAHLYQAPDYPGLNYQAFYPAFFKPTTIEPDCNGRSRSNSRNRQLVRVNRLSTLTELIAIAATVITGNRANQGPLGKSDRAFLLGLIGVLAGLNMPVYKVATPLLLLTQLLLIKTCINRLSYIVKYNGDTISTTTSTAAQNHAMYHATNQRNVMIDTTTNAADRITTNLIAEQSCYNAYDGTAIFYRYWLTKPLVDLKQPTESPLKQVILLHRGHEHSGRLSELGVAYVKAGYQVFAWDARGNGRSGGIKDHADSVTELERDLNDFVQLVIAQTGITIENTIVVASSIGAILAAAWAHDYAPTLRGMILGTPAISIRLYIPFAIPVLKTARKFGLMSRVSSYVKAQVLTHDKLAQQAYNNDPLISSSISSDLLIDTHATGQRLLDDAEAITIPTFVLCAGKDYVVDKQAERDFYEKLTSPIKRWQLYPNSYHAIFHETNKADIIADCIDFADSLFATPPHIVDLTHAHINSASKDRVDRLAIKPFNPSFAITRFAMQKFGHVSDAIATGLEHGFDSGSSLDKVYTNHPAGKNRIGKAIDSFYLNNIGWQGIRIRRQHLLELATTAIVDRQTQLQSQTQAQNQTQTQTKLDSSTETPIRLLDIASGNGYYAFDLLKQFNTLEAELRDYESHNISVINNKADQLQLSDKVTAVQKDAFDPKSYGDNAPAASTKPFDLAIASGVFELFSDNSLIATALTGIYDSLDAGGYFLYTNQPWHPEQEFISKTLNNHRGSNWVMRCRSQAEMDQLVTQAGFEKIDMRIDRFGIFTVGLARKPITHQAAHANI